MNLLVAYLAGLATIPAFFALLALAFSLASRYAWVRHLLNRVTWVEVTGIFGKRRVYLNEKGVYDLTGGPDRP
ncbi:MAG: hypothetical protein AB1760_00265 [Pseudomonadota bacterium]